MTKDNSFKSNPYIKYSTMVFQIFGCIVIFTYIGGRFDNYFTLEMPYLSLIGMLIGVLTGMILVIKDLTKTKKS